MPIKTKSIYDKIEPEDGVRILITRYRMGQAKKLGLYDHWFAALSPPGKVLSDYHMGSISFEELWTKTAESFVPNSRARLEIDAIKAYLKEGKTVSLLCYEKGPPCHRFKLAELIESEMK